MISDLGNSVIRVVAKTTGTFYGQAMTAGDIYTVAGDGSVGFGGDGGPATSAELGQPTQVAIDAFGNLVFADNGDNHIRVVAETTGKAAAALAAGALDALAKDDLDLAQPSSVAGAAFRQRIRVISHASVIRRPRARLAPRRRASRDGRDRYRCTNGGAGREPAGSARARGLGPVREPQPAGWRVLTRDQRLTATLTAAASGDRSGALALAASLVEAHPLDADAHFLHGLVALEAGEPARARDALRQALVADPHSASPRSPWAVHTTRWATGPPPGVLTFRHCAVSNRVIAATNHCFSRSDRLTSQRHAGPGWARAGPRPARSAASHGIISIPGPGPNLRAMH